MRVYWRRLGGHIHMRVFHNGKMGDLVCGIGEFENIRAAMNGAQFERDGMSPDDEKDSNGEASDKGDV